MGTKDVADFISRVNFNELPSDLLTKVKLCMLDTLGAAIAGCNATTVRIIADLVRSTGGIKEATVIGFGLQAPLTGATLVNSALSTVLDTDDGCSSPVGHLGHIGGCIIPAALAVAERENSSGKAFMEAVAAGYEVYLRTSWILTRPELKEFPLAGTPGAYGAAAASGKLLKLTREEIANALGIAEAYAPVPKMGRIAKTGPMTKEAMPWGAMTGVTAALLAREGFTGPTTIYDDPNYDRSCLDSLGKSYEMMRVYFKPYCACRYTHTALDVVLELVRQQALSPDDILNITVEVGSGASLLNTNRPTSIEHAEYSFPFLIGAALVDGEVGPKQVSEDRLGDKAILKQADKVRVIFSKAIDDLLPAKFGAVVTIETKNGNKYQVKRDFPKGEPENPLINEELEEKFRKWATTVIDSERAEKVLTSTRNLENVGSVNELVELLA